MTNILFQEEDLARIFMTAGLPKDLITCNNLALYQQAFVHLSFVQHQCKVGHFSATTSYDVLEFLGDGVLDLIIRNYLINRFEGAAADRFTQMKIGLVRSNTLASFAKFLNLHRFILIAEPIEFLSLVNIKVGRYSNDVLEDVFESFLGALFKDQGQNLNVCIQFVQALLEKQVDFEKLIRTDQDPKGTCYAYCNLQSWKMPRIIELQSLTTKEVAVALVMQREDCESQLETFAQNMIARNAAKFSAVSEEHQLKQDEILIAYQPYIGADRKKKATHICYTTAIERLKNKY